MARYRLVAIVAAGWPAAAFANAGIGLLMHAFPATMLMLGPAILIEAPILARLLAIDLKHGLGLASAANVFSAVVGALIAFFADMVLFAATGSSGSPASRGALIGALVPMFFVTWWLESRYAKRKLAGSTGTAKATLAANAASYAVLFAVSLSPVFAFLDRAEARNHLDEASRRLGHLTDAVEEYWKLHRRFPATLDEAGRVPRESAFAGPPWIEPGGRLVVRVRSNTLPEINGRQIVLEPRVKGDSIGWSCRLPQIPEEYWPHSCRRSAGK